MTDDSTLLEPYFPRELLVDLETRLIRRKQKTGRPALVIAEITRGTPRSPDPTDGALLVLDPGTQSSVLDNAISAHGFADLDLITIAADQDACRELEQHRTTLKRYQPHVLIEGSAEQAEAAFELLPHYREPRDLGDRLRHFEPIELRSLAAVHGKTEGAKCDVSFPIAGFAEDIDLNDEQQSFLWLAAFVRTYRPLRILEIGRGAGNSLYALAHHLEDRAHIDSYDIVPCGDVCEQSNVNTIVYDGVIESLDFAPYDFVFVDLDVDKGLERRVYRKMKADGFLGVSVWNGIRNAHRPRVERWWQRLDAIKLDASPTNDPLGTGLIWFK